MGKWNEEAAPNNNMTRADVRYSMKNRKHNNEIPEQTKRNERYQNNKHL
ncbi:hypothetical protein ACFSCZ_04485 [Siminovitchia sediminis]|uniref:Uncharacterized protein n=1 Tax=Siminovitchia sediminis TaxID=1274353 RepID=A0ABW4KFQ0_9BACI